MKNLTLLGICAALFGYHFYFKDRHDTSSLSAEAPVASAQFRCDGRTHCSQMTSCEEAKFFLDNCPGTVMDGDNDGIPCEKQWCR
ncbi:Excalibur calcium-binding domain protein [anaerobic digester metagenome]